LSTMKICLEGFKFMSEKRRLGLGLALISFNFGRLVGQWMCTIRVFSHSRFPVKFTIDSTTPSMCITTSFFNFFNIGTRFLFFIFILLLFTSCYSKFLCLFSFFCFLCLALASNLLFRFSYPPHFFIFSLRILHIFMGVHLFSHH
jgi:hypothetical protein